MKIQTLEIYTKKLEEQTEFYHQVLGLEIISKDGKSVSFQIGTSILKVTQSKEFTPYHFAVNIPCNQIDDALNWLKDRVEILKDDAHEIQDFDFWNAKAVYFYDKEDNIVEFIARKNLKNTSLHDFGTNSLINISEIGIPTLDINKEFEVLKDSSNLKIYDGNLERFCAVGDETGLFILINKKLKTEWFPTQDEPQSSPFKISFIEKAKEYKLEYKDETLSEIV